MPELWMPGPLVAGGDEMATGRAARALTAAISLYRAAISPLRPPTCRYLPTCSEYAVEAILEHGAGRGSWLALRRLLRCHPLHAGGHDPVPPRVDGARAGRRGPVEHVPSLHVVETAA